MTHKQRAAQIISGLFLFLAVAVFSSTAGAHMLTTEEREVGAIRVTLGYFADGAFAGEPLPLMIGLSRMPSDEPLDFADVTVRITPKGGREAFSETIPSKEKAAAFEYRFPRAGEYEIRLSFPEQDGKPLEATFPFAVVENPFAREPTIFDRMLGIFGN